MIIEITTERNTPKTIDRHHWESSRTVIEFSMQKQN